jgi:DNA recombination protein RmuC
MDPIFIIAVLVAGFVAIGFLINKKLSELSNAQKPPTELLEYLKTTNTRLDEHGRSLNERLDNAARVIGDVQKNIGEMSEIGRSMKDLQQFLQSPKLRGNIGEQVLKELLGQMLPKSSFHLQYAFKSGNKVDAAIKTAAGIVPIDSKFPMENFRKMMEGKTEEERKIANRDFERDVRKHIDDISRKYILTDEGTIDYALMYIPSEAIYYEIVNNNDLFEFASKSRVMPVSPTTFYAYMKAILMSFEGQKIEQKAREILSSIRAVQRDYVRVEDNLGVLQKHMTNAFNMMGNVYSSFTQLGQKITSIQNLGEGVKEEVKKLDG